jgi:hypothetical protein
MLYTKLLNEKLKVHSEKFLKEPQCGFCGGRTCTDAVISLKLIPKKEENSI